MLTYRGYPPSQPLFVHQYLTNAAWVQPRWISCGYGKQDLVLLPGQHVTWMAKMDAPNRLQRLRVGIESMTADYTVWSPIIDPATRRVGASPRS